MVHAHNPLSSPSQSFSPPPAAAPTAFVPRFWIGVATCGGVGKLPRAPGTFGSLVGLALAYGLWPWGVWALGTATLLVTVLGFVSCQQTRSHYNDRDAQEVVIDEVAGMLLTTWGLPAGAASPSAWLLLAFVLFRLLDIGKPGPIGWLDRRFKGGHGIMLDDLAAGALDCALLLAFGRLL